MHPTVRRGSLEPIALQGIFVGWNRRVPHGIKIATFRDDGEVEEVFTSTTVRTRGTVFPLFSGAGMKPATETELQEFGESVRVRPDDVEEPVLLSVAQLLKTKKRKGTPRTWRGNADDRGREQPDPEELRRVQWTDAKNNRAAAAMTPTAMNRQRDVSESLAQLCSCVPLLP